MLNINQTPNHINQLDFFNFDLDNFITNHLEDAVKDVKNIKNGHYILNDGRPLSNQNFQCQMGFIDDYRIGQRWVFSNSFTQSPEYAKDLSHKVFHLSCDSQINDQNSVAFKMTHTFHFDRNLTDKEVAIELLKNYCNWLKKRIHTMAQAAIELDFAILVKSTIHRGIFPDGDNTYGEWVYDDVFTKASLVQLIAQNLATYLDQLKERNLKHYSGETYLKWLLADDNLRIIFLTTLLNNEHLEQLIESNDRIYNLMFVIIDWCRLYDDSRLHNTLSEAKMLDITFISVILPILSALPLSEHQARSLFYGKLFIHSKKIIIYPIAFLNDLTFSSFKQLDDYETNRFIITNIADLNILLNDLFHDFVANIITMIKSAKIDLNGFQIVIEQQIDVLQSKKSLSTKEQDQLAVLQALKNKE